MIVGMVKTRINHLHKWVQTWRKEWCYQCKLAYWVSLFILVMYSILFSIECFFFNLDDERLQDWNVLICASFFFSSSSFSLFSFLLHVGRLGMPRRRTLCLVHKLVCHGWMVKTTGEKLSKLGHAIQQHQTALVVLFMQRSVTFVWERLDRPLLAHHHPHWLLVRHQVRLQVRLQDHRHQVPLAVASAATMVVAVVTVPHLVSVPWRKQTAKGIAMASGVKQHQSIVSTCRRSNFIFKKKKKKKLKITFAHCLLYTDCFYTYLHFEVE